MSGAEPLGRFSYTSLSDDPIQTPLNSGPSIQGGHSGPVFGGTRPLFGPSFGPTIRTPLVVS